MKIKKIIFASFCLCLLLLSLTCLVSCKEKLDAPVNLRLDESTLTLMWNRVPKARGYSLIISGDDKEKTIRTNSVSLEDLSPGVYEIKVKAIGDGIDYSDSEWVSYEFKRDTESGLIFNAIKNKTEYELTGLGSAKGDIVIPDEYRGKPVTSIANSAFAGSTDITSVTIGKNVRSIGKSAFIRCEVLVKVEFAEGSQLTSIGEYALQSCKKLESITLPDNLENVPAYIFSWCEGLRSVTVGENTKTICEYAFSSCEALESISLPDALTTINEYAFADCKLLSDFTFGPNVEVIGDAAFYNCSSITKAPIGDKLVSVGYFAFGYCVGLTELNIPDTCTDIGAASFYGCSELKDITVGSNVRYFGSQAFQKTEFYENADDIVYLGGWVIGCKDRKITELSLPEGIYGIGSAAFSGCAELKNIDFTGVKYINELAFAECVKLQTAVFDDSLIAIDSHVFYYCTLLRKVYLGNRLETIGDYAFAYCERLVNTKEAITLPKSLTSIGSSAFYKTAAYTGVSMGIVYIDDWAVDCINLGMFAYGELVFTDGTRGIADYCCDNIRIMGYVFMPNTVEIIGRGAFYGLNAVTAVYLPSNLKYIGDYAFYKCEYAQFGEYAHLTIPSRTEYIGRSAFYGCMGIAGLTVPSSVKTIGDYAFYKCENLGATVTNADHTEFYTGEIIFSEGIESIGNRAFYGCLNITEITLPDSLKKLGSRAFYKCTALKKLTIGSGLEEISDYCFYNCTSLEAINIPDTVKIVGKYAFRGCSSATTLTLGNSLESIGSYAFYSCAAIENIVIPTSTVTIGDYAFRSCSSVSSVVIPANVQSIGKHAFYGLSKGVIYCEAESIPADWHERFNSSYRPVFWGCTLSEDKQYIVSFVKQSDNPVNISKADIIAPPSRNGYVFEGFSTSPDATSAEYTLTNITEAADGTVIYSVWTVDPELSVTE